MDNIENVVKGLINNVPNIVKLLRQNKGNEAYTEFGKIFNELNNAMLTFINAIPAINSMGLDIPTEVVISQLNNMVEGFQYKDNVLLADTLEYEIMESMKLYDEILMQIQ